MSKNYAGIKNKRFTTMNCICCKVHEKETFTYLYNQVMTLTNALVPLEYHKQILKQKDIEIHFVLISIFDHLYITILNFMNSTYGSNWALAGQRTLPYITSYGQLKLSLVFQLQNDISGIYFIQGLLWTNVVSLKNIWSMRAFKGMHIVCKMTNISYPVGIHVEFVNRKIRKISETISGSRKENSTCNFHK